MLNQPRGSFPDVFAPGANTCAADICSEINSPKVFLCIRGVRIQPPVSIQNARGQRCEYIFAKVRIHIFLYLPECECRGLEKGVITKGVFSPKACLESLESLNLAEWLRSSPARIGRRELLLPSPINALPRGNRSPTGVPGIPWTCCGPTPGGFMRSR